MEPLRRTNVNRSPSGEHSQFIKGLSTDRLGVTEDFEGRPRGFFREYGVLRGFAAD